MDDWQKQRSTVCLLCECTTTHTLRLWEVACRVPLAHGDASGLKATCSEAATLAAARVAPVVQIDRAGSDSLPDSPAQDQLSLLLVLPVVAKHVNGC